MAGHTENAVIIKAPEDLVWEMTNDVESWPWLFSEYSAAEVLERVGDTVIFRLTMHPDDDGRVWSWISKRTMDPKTRTVQAHRVTQGFFEYMNLAWDFQPVDGGVQMRWVQDFQLRREALIDEPGMENRINTNSAVQMARIKKLVEQAATENKSVAEMASEHTGTGRGDTV